MRRSARSWLHHCLDGVRGFDDVAPRLVRQRDRLLPGQPGTSLRVPWRHDALEPWRGWQLADLLGEAGGGSDRFPERAEQPGIDGDEERAGPAKRAFVATFTGRGVPAGKSLAQDLCEECQRVPLVATERQQRATIQECVGV